MLLLVANLSMMHIHPPPHTDSLSPKSVYFIWYQVRALDILVSTALPHLSSSSFQPIAENALQTVFFYENPGTHSFPACLAFLGETQCSRDSLSIRAQTYGTLIAWEPKVSFLRL